MQRSHLTSHGNKPSESQRQRTQNLRRFNWLYVYGPLILGALVILVLSILMFWGVFSPNVMGTAAFLSGAADMVIILFAIPAMLLCVLGPVALAGLVVMLMKSRQSRQEKKARGDFIPDHGRLQPLFWRLDQLLVTAASKVDNAGKKVANPLISFNARLAYLDAWWLRVRRLLLRS